MTMTGQALYDWIAAQLLHGSSVFCAMSWGPVEIRPGRLCFVRVERGSCQVRLGRKWKSLEHKRITVGEPSRLPGG